LTFIGQTFASQRCQLLFAQGTAQIWRPTEPDNGDKSLFIHLCGLAVFIDANDNLVLPTTLSLDVEGSEHLIPPLRTRFASCASRDQNFEYFAFSFSPETKISL
jgi:hypothetical protein